MKVVKVALTYRRKKMPLLKKIMQILYYVGDERPLLAQLKRCKYMRDGGGERKGSGHIYTCFKESSYVHGHKWFSFFFLDGKSSNSTKHIHQCSLNTNYSLKVEAPTFFYHGFRENRWGQVTIMPLIKNMVDKKLRWFSTSSTYSKICSFKNIIFGVCLVYHLSFE